MLDHQGLKLYKQWSTIFDSWVFYIKKGSQWYTYMCGTNFARIVWPDDFDTWIPSENQDVYISHGIVKPASKLEFLLLTGKDIGESTKDLKEDKNEDSDNGGHPHWSLGPFGKDQSHYWVTYPVGGFSH